MKVGDRVRVTRGRIAGDVELNQTGTINRLTFDGLAVLEYDNGCLCNTHVGIDHIEKIKMDES